LLPLSEKSHEALQFGLPPPTLSKGKRFRNFYAFFPFPPPPLGVCADLPWSVVLPSPGILLSYDIRGFISEKTAARLSALDAIRLVRSITGYPKQSRPFPPPDRWYISGKTINSNIPSPSHRH